MPFIFVATLATTYIVVSIFSRFAYCYLYRFALLDNKTSRFVRKTLTFLTHVNFDSKAPGAIINPFTLAKKSSVPINDLQNIIDCFAIQGEVIDIKQINKGYINRTYKVSTLSASGNVHKWGSAAPVGPAGS